MEIYFKSNKLAKTCSDERLMDRRLGRRRAELLRQRLVEFSAAASLEDLRHLPRPKCHELTGDRAGQLSVDLDQPYRLLFEPADHPVPGKPDGGLDWNRVTCITIIEIADPH